MQARLAADWSIVPVMLKPDAIEGAHAAISGRCAADFATYLGGAIASCADVDYQPFVAESRAGADRARAHVMREISMLDWYVPDIRDIGACQARLRQLHLEWQAQEHVAVPEVIVRGSAALGFGVTHQRSLVVTEADYVALYKDKPQTSKYQKLKQYLIGKPVTILLLCGQQENSALQMLKTYLRHVVRYPTEAVRVENWLHVANPNAMNYPELLRMFAEPSSRAVDRMMVR